MTLGTITWPWIGVQGSRKEEEEEEEEDGHPNHTVSRSKPGVQEAPVKPR